jgi:lipopolysaccharide/colanic/teichoic acid biosynthesis glycosyltransferase
MLTNFFATARKLLRPSGSRALADLLSREQMRKALTQERARTDRTANHFAVVAFALLGGEQPPEVWERLVKVLRSRLRLIDEVGWLEDGQLGAVLVGSGAEGAWKVVSDVKHRLADNVPPMCCTVHVYPSDDASRALVPAGHQTNGKVNGKACPSVSPEHARASGAIEPLFEQTLPLWKRTLDVIGAVVGLVLLAPLFAAVALAIKLTSPGPVFFGQLRSGRGGKPFVMWKFRSMVADAEVRKKELLALNEQDGAAFKMKNDPRITPLGCFLRKSSIDELPQLWNVLRGEMSLVGPRPLPSAETDVCAGWQRQRLDVTPGLTCIWQVRGRCRVSFVDWVRMDVQYIRSRSLGQDLKLLLLTVPVVLLRRGAH